MTYSTKSKAVSALIARGFALVENRVMGSAPYRNGHAHAWIDEVWVRGKIRYATRVAA